MSKPAVKIWGDTERIHRLPNTSLHVINIKKSGYCSIHRHATKGNMFLLESGRVEIREWIFDYKPGEKHDVTYVLETPGDTLNIPAGTVHQFAAVEDSVVYEFYYADGGELDEEDIERFTVGGVE